MCVVEKMYNYMIRNVLYPFDNQNAIDKHTHIHGCQCDANCNLITNCQSS